MRFVFLLLLCINVVAQKPNYWALNTPAGCWPAEAPLGYIYNKSSFANTSDFTVHGDATATLSGSAINFENTGSLWSSYATFLTPADFSNYTVTMDVKMINAVTSSSYGIGLGLKSINVSFPQEYIGWTNLSSSGTTGQVLLYKADGTAISNSGGTVVSWSTNDVLRMTFSLADTVMTYTTYNLTTGGTPVSQSYTFTNATSPLYTRPNASYFQVNTVGGQFQVQALSVNVTDKVNSNVVVAGDSKFAYYAGDWAHSWPLLLNNSYGYGTVTRFCGSGDQASMGLQEIYNISLLHPRYLIWYYGSNDLRASVPTPTVAAISDSVYNYFTARGTTVIFMLIPEDSTAGGIGQKALDNYYRAAYSGHYLSGVWDDFSVANVALGIYLADANVHPNALGHARIALSINASGLLKAVGVCYQQPSNNWRINLAALMAGVFWTYKRKYI